VGTFAMALAFNTQGLITCVHKHYSVEEVSHSTAKALDLEH
jgi:hypothetical protein